VPSEKRARQRAMRQAKVEHVQKHKRRSRRLRRVGGAALVAALVVGVIALVSQHSQPAKNAAIKPVCLSKGQFVATTRHTKFTSAPPMCISAKATYDATFKTDAGTFVVAMVASKSPKAVNNFVFLAEHRFYDGTKFHRVIPGFVVQGGDPTGTGKGGPGYSWTGNTPPRSCEAAKSCYPVWGVAYANSTGPKTNESQFFIVLPGGEKILDAEPNYTLFGSVVLGRPVVNRIAKDGTPSGKPKRVHDVITVTIAEATR
jgi:peptidylprolyl isomerase/peptidyl-prolyl cis-trans isomerase B (cyclophilin B)